MSANEIRECRQVCAEPVDADQYCQTWSFSYKQGNSHAGAVCSSCGILKRWGRTQTCVPRSWTPDGSNSWCLSLNRASSSSPPKIVCLKVHLFCRHGLNLITAHYSGHSFAAVRKGPCRSYPRFSPAAHRQDVRQPGTAGSGPPALSWPGPRPVQRPGHGHCFHL